MGMENGAPTNGDLDAVARSWRCWHIISKKRMGKFKSCRKKMKGWQSN
jgi:hypothetical protein